MSVKIGKNCKIGNLRLSPKYKEIIIGDNVTIEDDVRINVVYLKIGDRSTIGEGFNIEGTHIELGTEFDSGENCIIGGGSCHELPSYLKIGDNVHLDINVLINTTRPVIIGNEVGLGGGTRLFTHGAYLNFLEGFPCKTGPITIGNNVHIANATVLPNITIGDNVMVSALTLVNKNLPSGCLAGGVPVKLLKENYYPIKYTEKELEMKLDELVAHFTRDIIGETIGPKKIVFDGGNKMKLYVDNCMTLFDFNNKRIDGQASEFCERFKNEARRWGFRFKYYNDNGMYKQW